VGVDGDRLPPAVETALYRVTQEALTNVLRHAGAGRVSVVLQRPAGQVIVVVEDDGRGFDPESAPAAGPRLGLVGMRERLTLVGGSLTVESAPGRGTTLIAQVPLPGGRAAAQGVPGGEGAGPDRPRAQGVHPAAPGGRGGRVRAQAGGGRGADPGDPGGGRRGRLPGPDDGRQGGRRVRPPVGRGR